MAQVAPVFDTAHSGAIHDAQLDYYGKFLASCSADHSIRIWDVSADIPRFLSELKGHDGPVWQVSWAHPKYGNLLASCSYDRKVVVWKEQSLGVWVQIYVTDEHTSSVNAIQFAPWELGLHLACGSSDGTVSILSYHPESGLWSRKVFNAHPNGVLSVGWCPATTTAAAPIPSNSGAPTPAISMKRLVTGGCDNQVRVWNFVESTNEWIESHQMSGNGHQRWVRDVSWRCHAGVANNLVASCSDDGTVILWQESDGQPWKNRQVIHMDGAVWRVSWSATGTVLAVACGFNTVTLLKENLHGVWEALTESTEIHATETNEEKDHQDSFVGDSIPPTPNSNEYGDLSQLGFPASGHSSGALSREQQMQQMHPQMQQFQQHQQVHQQHQQQQVQQQQFQQHPQQQQPFHQQQQVQQPQQERQQPHQSYPPPMQQNSPPPQTNSHGPPPLPQRPQQGPPQPHQGNWNNGPQGFDARYDQHGRPQFQY